MAERFNIASGKSISALPSPAIWMIRSAKPITRSRRCSAITTVKLKSCTSRCNIERTSSAAIGSSALVGSSSTNTFGFITKALPIATRCCSPPLSVEISRSRRCDSANKSKISSTRLRIKSGAIFNASIPKASSSSTISVTKPCAGFCPTIPTKCESSPGLTNLVEIPSTEISPAKIPPV